MNVRYLLQDIGEDGRMYDKHLKETGHEGSAGSG
jgi:hypothetical protein